MSDAAERRLLDPEAHILVVEDDGEMRNLVARLLREVAKRRVGADPFDRTVDVQVSRLRRKIEPEDDSPSLIKTVRGAGYVLVADVTRA